MNNQTENYIILKPIAERFNRVANDITDDEIKGLIKYEMGQQLRKIDFYSTISNIVEDYLDEHTEDILKLYKREIENRFQYNR